MSLHINYLPCEVIQNILEYLSMEDRKSASLVCRVWDQEAFSTRLQSSVQLHVYFKAIKDWNKALSVLQNSCRSYRNLYVTIYYTKLPRYGTVALTDNYQRQYNFVTTILGKFGSKVESFGVEGICPWVQLTEFLTRMPNLKDIKALVGAAGNHQTKQRMEVPVLRNLYSLHLEYNSYDAHERNQFDAPTHQWVFEILKGHAVQLQTLNIKQTCEIPADELQFDKLQVLRLRGWPDHYDNTELHRLLHRLPLLKTLDMHCYGISHTLLEIICNNCPLLMSLSMGPSHNLGTLPFQCLKNLKNLQVLKLGDISSRMMGQCKPMTNVTEVHFVDTSGGANLDQLYEVFPNVHTLSVDYPNDRENIFDHYLVRQICRKFIHLKKLTLVDISRGIDVIRACKPFITPIGLENVEELTLRGRKMRLNNLPLLMNLKRLKLEYYHCVCWKKIRIQKNIPNLRYLEIRNYGQIEPRMIARIRRSNPNCAVKYVRTERVNRFSYWAAW